MHHTTHTATPQRYTVPNTVDLGCVLVHTSDGRESHWLQSVETEGRNDRELTSRNFKLESGHVSDGVQWWRYSRRLELLTVRQR